MVIRKSELVRRLFSRTDTQPLMPGALSFRCNICGADNCAMAQEIDRESGGCHICGSNVRFRSLAAVLTQRLCGKIKVLASMDSRFDLRGTGMSDHECYAGRLAEKFNYTNTYFHRKPLLDVTKPSEQWIDSSDFIISSDVFEHVAPPVQTAFDNLYSMLKPGGLVVFSVPFSLENESREHFPHLFDYTVREIAGKWVLRNVRQDGTIEEFDNLVFHGGPGTTLEMRLFSLSALTKHFELAGFSEFQVHSEPEFEYGIFWPNPWSVTISAIRAA
jgi:SAM-dependent methyltransferase